MSTCRGDAVIYFTVVTLSRFEYWIGGEKLPDGDLSITFEVLPHPRGNGAHPANLSNILHAVHCASHM